MQPCHYAPHLDTERHAQLQAQWREAVDSHTICCADCGQIHAIELAYRCRYCGRWSCFTCAERHFGQTVADYRRSANGAVVTDAACQGDNELAEANLGHESR